MIESIREKTGNIKLEGLKRMVNVRHIKAYKKPAHVVVKR